MVNLPKVLALTCVTSTFLWIILSTIFTTSSEVSFKLIDTLHNKKIQLLIAHPDDEVMFFGPTLNELLKPEYNNTIFVTCFSTGNDAGLGDVRAGELERSLQILGIDQYEIIDDETKFKDSMNLIWETTDILEYVQQDTDVLLTFDSEGVSSHPNHISLYNAARESKLPLLTLHSWNIIEKYSSTILTNHTLLQKLLRSSLKDVIQKFEEFKEHHTNITSSTNHLKEHKSQEIIVFADISSFLLTLSAMLNGHKSQMVWFRWGWVFISRYLNSNQLTFIDSTA